MAEQVCPGKIWAWRLRPSPFFVVISVMLVNNDIVLGNRTSGDSEISHSPPPPDISKRPAVSAAVILGAMHLLAMSWATLGALGYVEFELGGEL